MKTRRLAAALAAALFAGAEGRAAALPFHATLRIDFQFLLDFDGTGTAVSDGAIGGAFDTLALPQSAAATPALFANVTDPAAAPIHGVVLTAVHNVAGTLARSAGGHLGGTMPLAGTMKVCLFAPCASAIANLVVPLGSPIVVATNNLPAGGQNTVHGAPWTTGTVMLATNLTYMGGAHGPASGTSTTFSPGGRIQLVAPARVISNLAIVPLVATLTIDFVPEPASGVLLGGGVALLAAIGRRAS
jgi:hypothetical protein